MINREKDTFPCQPETNPKGRASAGGSVPDNLRKINIVITLRPRGEIDNHINHNLNKASYSPNPYILLSPYYN